jgi:hypothetical protein
MLNRIKSRWAQALLFADPSRVVHPALVNGAAGVVIAVDGKLGAQSDGQAAASPVGSTG